MCAVSLTTASGPPLGGTRFTSSMATTLSPSTGTRSKSVWSATKTSSAWASRATSAKVRNEQWVGRVLERREAWLADCGKPPEHWAKRVKRTNLTSTFCSPFLFTFGSPFLFTLCSPFLFTRSHPSLDCGIRCHKKCHQNAELCSGPRGDDDEEPAHE